MIRTDTNSLVGRIEKLTYSWLHKRYFSSYSWYYSSKALENFQAGLRNFLEKKDQEPQPFSSENHFRTSLMNPGGCRGNCFQKGSMRSFTGLFLRLLVKLVNLIFKKFKEKKKGSLYITLELYRKRRMVY